MLRRIVSTLFFCGLAVVAPAQRIDMATLAPADSTWYKVMENMGAELKKISSGKVNLVIHAGGVLGDEPECVRRLGQCCRYRCSRKRNRAGSGSRLRDN